MRCKRRAKKGCQNWMSLLLIFGSCLWFFFWWGVWCVRGGQIRTTKRSMLTLTRQYRMCILTRVRYGRDWCACCGRCCSRRCRGHGCMCRRGATQRNSLKVMTVTSSHICIVSKIHTCSCNHLAWYVTCGLLEGPSMARRWGRHSLSSSRFVFCNVKWEWGRSVFSPCLRRCRATNLDNPNNNNNNNCH